jgi:hypothetical protein
MPKSPSVSVKDMLKQRQARGRRLALADHRRPQTRAECEQFERPCPFVGCRHHLFLDVTAKGSIRFPFGDDVSVIETMAQTCSLDGAEQGETPVDELAKVFELSAQGMRLLYWQAMTHIGIKDDIRQLALETEGCDPPEAREGPEPVPKKAVRPNLRSGRHIKEMLRGR